MVVKYIGKEIMDFLVKDNDIDLIPQKHYEVLSVKGNWYTLIDESGEDYSYPAEMFEIVEE